jgi:hypothetical protein
MSNLNGDSGWNDPKNWDGSDFWNSQPINSNRTIMTSEELSIFRKLTSEVKKINENNIVIDPIAQKLYAVGKEFYMESYSFTSTPSSEFVEIKLLVNFDKPITGEQK